MMLRNLLLRVLLCLSVAYYAAALNNGVALTPPMGWMSWQRFRCLTDCSRDPDDCISEKLIKQIADRMVDDGYLAAGYQYVVIDDCWLSKNRTRDGKLQEDPVRFPSGMKALADYVHSKGLKFGIYENYGTYTCGGYPGVIDHMEKDAKTLAEMGADYVKLDGCYADPMDMDQGYIKFGQLLQMSGRKIVYSCSWPVYQEVVGITPNLSLISEHCNLWRNWGDIQDSWESVKSILNYFADRQELIAKHAGPGHWNDPDMLIIGNYGLSYEQAKAQMAMWAILAAPLMMSHDLRNVRPEFREILLNKGAIEINQNRNGIQGKRVYSVKHVEIWTRPVYCKDYAVAFLNKRTDGSPVWVHVKPKRIGLRRPIRYYVFYEIFTPGHKMFVYWNSTISVRIPPSGVKFYRAAYHQYYPKADEANDGA